MIVVMVLNNSYEVGFEIEFYSERRRCGKNNLSTAEWRFTNLYENSLQSCFSRDIKRQFHWFTFSDLLFHIIIPAATI